MEKDIEKGSKKISVEIVLLIFFIMILSFTEKLLKGGILKNKSVYLVKKRCVV